MERRSMEMTVMRDTVESRTIHLYSGVETGIRKGLETEFAKMTLDWSVETLLENIPCYWTIH